MVAKKFQLPYTAVIVLSLKLQKIDCATRTFNKFTVVLRRNFCILSIRQMLQLLQYNCFQYFQKLKKLNLLQAKVQNPKRKAVNVSESNTSGISYNCNASVEVRDPSSAWRFT